MSLAEYIEEQKEETREIIAEMLQDGLDSDAAYMIEHHFAADNLAECEALTLDARSMGYEVNPAEEYELDPEAGEGTIFCFDVLVESDLDAELIDEQSKVMFDLAEKHKVDYDGWGTSIGEGDDEEDEE
jgi:hypothetical protein